MIAEDIRKLAVHHDYRYEYVKLHDCTVLLRLTSVYLRHDRLAQILIQ